MSDHEKIREQVKEAYAKAVSRPPSEEESARDGMEGPASTASSGGAPSSESCCGKVVSPSKGVLALLAGYTDEELRSLPRDAAVNSFGCGNPLALSEIAEGDTVLDLGSGAGIDILLAARIVGPTGKAIGVDMTDEMIERAKANAAAAGLNNVDIRKGIIEELPVDSESVDWVISNCVINLSPEKEKVFAEIARVLKPGGRMLVSDVVLDEAPDFLRSLPALHGSCIAGAISEKEYKEGLAAAGLAGVEARSRQEYDCAAIARLVVSEEVSGCGCGGGLSKELVESFLEANRVVAASVGFFARKPV